MTQAGGIAHSPSIGTYANPLDLAYKIQDQSVGPLMRRVNREAADPSVVLYKDRFYLFASMSGGFWHSSDLAEWTFVAAPELPAYDYAPDVREIDGQLVVCASRRGKPCPFFRTDDPLSGRWEEIPGSRAFWDPNLFQDDDGRVYLYQGCSARTPIDAVEVDRSTFRSLAEPEPVIASNMSQRGWERRGESYDQTKDKDPVLLSLLLGSGPYLEGAWMTKHAGRYYLQYSAPGTRFNTYADGYYVGSSPIGPFEYAPNSPFSLKPGGFITGAGHGSTFQDRHGNWWHAATMRISVNDIFERRVGLFPAGFDEDGLLFCCQEFGDYPVAIPAGPADPWSLTGRSMLLSYARPVTASSSMDGHEAHRAVDEDIRSWWVPVTADAGEWLQVELPEGALVESVQVNLAEHEWDRMKPRPRDGVRSKRGSRAIDLLDLPTPFLLEGSADGESWTTLADARPIAANRTHAWVTLEEPRALRYVRVTGGSQPYGTAFALSGLRVFGQGAGAAPAAVTPRLERTGALNLVVDWAPDEAAHGYNVRWGVASDKLYSCWQVLGSSAQLDIGALNAGVPYWVAVDSFNENGVTRGRAVPAPAWDHATAVPRPSTR